MLLQTRQRRLKVSGRERHMGGERRGRLRSSSPPIRWKVRKPSMMNHRMCGSCRPCWDFLKPKDVSVEGGAGIHVPHIEGDMMQGEEVETWPSSMPDEPTVRSSLHHASRLGAPGSHRE